MTNKPWSKFFWADWEADERLFECSLAAQGLWMRMLCICAKGEPYGYLAVAEKPLDAAGVARRAGISTDEAATLMAELEQWGVFSRDRKGRIYSRRMVKDQKAARTSQKNGQRGGNPSLTSSARKQRENQARDNPPEKGADNTSRVPASQRPEAREGKKDPPNGGSQKTHGTRLPDDWQPCEIDIAAAKREGLSDDAIQRESNKFRDYWHAQPGQRGRKADWSATWRNWCRKAAESRQQRPNAASSGGRRKSAPSVVDVTADLVSGTDSQ